MVDMKTEGVEKLRSKEDENRRDAEVLLSVRLACESGRARFRQLASCNYPVYNLYGFDDR